MNRTNRLTNRGPKESTSTPKRRRVRKQIKNSPYPLSVLFDKLSVSQIIIGVKHTEPTIRSKHANRKSNAKKRRRNNSSENRREEFKERGGKKKTKCQLITY